ncbi:MAG: ARMT1-like domain-containing protein [Candidatus Omnitrophica bacterium]|nr:ARMT1-like domain-containing protein [Candidatus Omnitrophota bacterium]MDD5429486.1 ARMT1-like domain-containing protein [Candidatus Omnitrophota bacterium]
MKTFLDCIPCFFRQALETSRMVGAGKKKQKAILDKIAAVLPQFSLQASPPEMAREINILISKITGNKDPYREIKKKSNQLALRIYPDLKSKVFHSNDRLLTAVELAIAGNIIDYGVKNSLNVSEELKKILSQEKKAIKKEKKSIFDYAKFKRTVIKAENILYLADNAGETVFDRVLIEEIKSMDKSKNIIYAVKASPVINDALLQDAVFCGIDKLATIISSGSNAPGTVLSLCTKSFLGLYRKADMVISKGQGNFEALSGARRPIFFLFMAKCPVIAEYANCNLGDIALLYSEVN